MRSTRCRPSRASAIAACARRRSATTSRRSPACRMAGSRLDEGRARHLQELGARRARLLPRLRHAAVLPLRRQGPHLGLDRQPRRAGAREVGDQYGIESRLPAFFELARLPGETTEEGTPAGVAAEDGVAPASRSRLSGGRPPALRPSPRRVAGAAARRGPTSRMRRPICGTRPMSRSRSCACRTRSCVSRVARTVALRGSPARIAISPKNSPRPRRTSSASMSSISTSPETMKYIASACSPRRATISPRWTERECR